LCGRAVYFVISKTSISLAWKWREEWQGSHHIRYLFDLHSQIQDHKFNAFFASFLSNYLHSHPPPWDRTSGRAKSRTNQMILTRMMSQ
jgi:hypothetical protein